MAAAASERDGWVLVEVRREALLGDLLPACIAFGEVRTPNP
jgi:hypothetical protein